jgi:hypothetical protein
MKTTKRRPRRKPVRIRVPSVRQVKQARVAQVGRVRKVGKA